MWPFVASRDSPIQSPNVSIQTDKIINPNGGGSGQGSEGTCVLTYSSGLSIWSWLDPHKDYKEHWLLWGRQFHDYEYNPLKDDRDPPLWFFYANL